jgi:uncharacterized membrane protein YbaN (DUF454 family)
MLQVRRKLILAAGFVLVGLALLGVMLPLLPTTPLLILAAACFANASERWHKWLMNHPLCGPLLKDWHERRCIPLRAKLIAATMIILIGAYSIGFAIENAFIRLFGTLLLLTGLIVVLRIPTCSGRQ